jgi:hypothetical protein
MVISDCSLQDAISLQSQLQLLYNGFSNENTTRKINSPIDQKIRVWLSRCHARRYLQILRSRYHHAPYPILTLQFIFYIQDKYPLSHKDKEL